LEGTLQTSIRPDTEVTRLTEEVSTSFNQKNTQVQEIFLQDFQASKLWEKDSFIE